MEKSAEAYRSIGEVARLIGVAPHVLRYWETQFPQLAPVKRSDGRRYYRLDDLRLAAGLAEVLREEGMTTRGAARLIALDKGATVRAKGLKRLPARFGEEAEEAGTTGAEASRLTGGNRRETARRAAEPLPLFPEAEPALPRGGPGTVPTPGATLARLARVGAALRAPREAALPQAPLLRVQGRIRALLDASR